MSTECSVIIYEPKWQV